MSEIIEETDATIEGLKKLVSHIVDHIAYFDVICDNKEDISEEVVDQWFDNLNSFFTIVMRWYMEKQLEYHTYYNESGSLKDFIHISE